MQITLLICLLSILPTIFGAPDDGCPMCDLRESLRCGSNCLKIDDQDLDTVEVNPSRQGDSKPSPLSSKYRLMRNSGDLLCLNFPPKGKFNRLDGDIDGFIINKGKYISLKDLLKVAHSNRGFKSFFKSPFDNHQESIDDMKQPFEDIGDIVLGRGGWDKLRPPWG